MQWVAYVQRQAPCAALLLARAWEVAN
jgi:hypothetical protein